MSCHTRMCLFDGCLTACHHSKVNVHFQLFCANCKMTQTVNMTNVRKTIRKYNTKCFNYKFLSKCDVTRTILKSWRKCNIILKNSRSTHWSHSSICGILTQHQTHFNPGLGFSRQKTVSARLQVQTRLKLQLLLEHKIILIIMQNTTVKSTKSTVLWLTWQRQHLVQC